MKKLLLSIITAGLLLAACNQNGKTNTARATADTAKTDSATAAAGGTAMSNAPVFKFDNDTHNFGKIKEGDKVTYKFNFTNAGKSPLIISDAVASCGCTTPIWPKEPIKPGDSGQVTVTFNSAGKTGLQDKMITITANTNPAQTMVHLVGQVTEK